MYTSRVVYARLVNTGNYENERFEAEVLIHPEESPEMAFQLAVTVVEGQIKAQLATLSTFEEDAEIPY